MDVHHMVSRLSPDFAQVWQRFPLAILFALGGTIVALIQANSLLPWSEDEGLYRLVGFATGAVLALAGRLFAESRPDAPRSGFILSYLLPFAALALFELRSTDWVVLPMIPVVAVMWLSVSAFTRIGMPAERRDIEDRFWWLNQRAIVSGLMAIAATAIFSLGLLIVDRSLDLLFGFSLWQILSLWVLPIVYFLLAPIYWLAVLPRLGEYEKAALEAPDFLVKAIGLIGVFVLTPLLIVYDLILVAYAVQIVVLQTLPVGVFGWLVTTFIVTGAANWLILHPAFIRDRLLSRLYRRLWFWSTLLPLALLAIGLFVRISAYGLTPERMLLVAGFAWALTLSLVYCLPGRRGDIRLVPALAGLAFLVLGLGPFSLLAAPNADQAARFERALTAALTDDAPDWTPELAAAAGGALDYLALEETGRGRLVDILYRHGFAAGNRPTATKVAVLIGLPADATADFQTSETWSRPSFAADSVAGTPYLIGEVSAAIGPGVEQGGVTLSIAGLTLVATETSAPGVRSETDLSDWLGRQDNVATITDPAIDFSLGPRRYRLIARLVQVDRVTAEAQQVTFLGGLLFSDTP